MLELDSPGWSEYTHAYGDASDVPSLFAKLCTATPDGWDDANAELTNAVMHQGDVYTAAYAIAPHLLEYARELGPGKQSDDLLFSIAYASRGGPEVPEALEEAWEDAQDEARDLNWNGCFDQKHPRNTQVASSRVCCTCQANHQPGRFSTIGAGGIRCQPVAQPAEPKQKSSGTKGLPRV